MAPLSDEDLLARYRSGNDPTRIDELFQRYHSKVAVWCYRFTGDRELAGDLAQEIFLRAYRNLDSFRGSAKFSTWLYTVARNHCVNEMKARQGRSAESLDFEVEDSSAVTVLDAMEQEESKRVMRSLIEQNLDETEKKVVVMHFADGIGLDAVTRWNGGRRGQAGDGPMNEHISRALGPGADCPSLEELLDWTAGKYGESRQNEANAHLAVCFHCSTELALFWNFEQAAVRPEEKADVEAIAARLRANSPVERTAWWKPFVTVRWLAPAALAMAALLVAVVLWSPDRGRHPIVSEGDDAMRSGRMKVIGPVGALASAPLQLEWAAVKGAARYRVTLSEVDRTPVWSSTVEASEAALPDDIVARIVPLKPFVWKVAALEATGAVIADSGIQQFRVDRSHP